MHRMLEDEREKKRRVLFHSPSGDAFPSAFPGLTFRNAYEFDMGQLPTDLQRVCGHLAERRGEEYAMHVAFTVRTAVELHRAWHMTLLTSKLLQQLKDRFDLRMTWTLGVLRLKFRVEDGDYELHRKVPYDYDSEFQDKYARIAVALMEGHFDARRPRIDFCFFFSGGFATSTSVAVKKKSASPRASRIQYSPYRRPRVKPRSPLRF